ncbi:hypothetical protein PSEUBRA_002667 [Kalmanozyma brasiliensis GHG001]|uniref:uncharacterized protein n=1 Tax=Kalmanozyma brasiliensis (strain GHG001) TaxID=1365824 RepID=UPI002867B795|nr:uncharacterized protein PSEUBRA_002667 [Kalmanozyma brasiliensis GHG001]KAF6767114.1 hypothetical protein PSEUBRA_002667 [Kalmanozyma brasiliensis GHG001]
MTDKAIALGLFIDTSRQRTRRLQNVAIPSASTSVQRTPGTSESYLDLTYTPSTACTNLSVAPSSEAKVDPQWIISQIDEYLAHLDVPTFKTTKPARRSARLWIETDPARLSVVERALASSPDALDSGSFLTVPSCSPGFLSPFFRGFTLATDGVQDAAPFPYSPGSALDASWNGKFFDRPSILLESAIDSDSDSGESYRTTPQSSPPSKATSLCVKGSESREAHWTMCGGPTSPTSQAEPVASLHVSALQRSQVSPLGQPAGPLQLGLARSASTGNVGQIPTGNHTDALDFRPPNRPEALSPIPACSASKTSHRPASPLVVRHAETPPPARPTALQRSNTSMEIRPGNRAMLGSHKPRGRKSSRWLEGC